MCSVKMVILRLWLVITHVDDHIIYALFETIFTYFNAIEMRKNTQKNKVLTSQPQKS